MPLKAVLQPLTALLENNISTTCCCILLFTILGGTVAQRLALLSHSKKVQGFIHGKKPLCGLCIFSPCHRRVPPGAVISPTTKHTFWSTLESENP